MDTMRVAVALLTPHNAGVAKGEGHAGVALVAGNSGWTDALAGDRVADGRVGAVAWLAGREAKVSSAALGTSVANDVLLALALAPKALALKGQGAVNVALARQRTVVVLGSQREHSLLAEITGICADVEAVLPTLLDEFNCLVQGKTTQHRLVKLVLSNQHQVVQPHRLLVWHLEAEREVVHEVESSGPRLRVDQHSTAP